MVKYLIFLIQCHDSILLSQITTLIYQCFYIKKKLNLFIYRVLRTFFFHQFIPYFMIFLEILCLFNNIIMLMEYFFKNKVSPIVLSLPIFFLSKLLSYFQKYDIIFRAMYISLKVHIIIFFEKLYSDKQKTYSNNIASFSKI